MRASHENQQKILDFIKAEIEDKGYPPSVREICAAVGLRSTSTVHAHLNHLEAQGLIRRDPTKPAPVVNEQIDQNCSCYVGVSYLSRTLYIFCCNTDRQSDVVVNYLIEKMRRSMHTKE